MKAKNPVATLFRYVGDSMQNLMSGLGTVKDKSTAARFMLLNLSQQELETAYRSDWMARKIVDVPANDATREWRGWQAEQDDIEKLEDAEKYLCIPHKTRDVLRKARLYGGSALVMGIKNDKQPEKELNVEKVGEGDLEFVHVVSKFEITAGPLDLNVLSTTYGEPAYYEVNSANRGMVRIHPSRVLRFVGNPLPSLSGMGVTENQWGDSILLSAYDSVVAAAQSLAAIAFLIQEAKVDVIKIPGLMANMGTEDYRSRLIERFQLANTGKSLVNSLILDKEEEWQRIQQTFNGLPDLLNVFLTVVAGAADIPVTRMLGQSPAGLNSTGEGDLTNYYDNVASEQTNTIEPILNRLDEVLIRSALGKRPEEIYYEWNPLWQMSDKDKATVDYQNAQTFQIDVNAGLIDPMALKKARINQLIEAGTYPGLDGALQEAEAEALSGESDEERAAFEAARKAKLAAQNPQGDPNADPADDPADDETT